MELMLLIIAGLLIALVLPVPGKRADVVALIAQVVREVLRKL